MRIPTNRGVNIGVNIGALLLAALAGAMTHKLVFTSSAAPAVPCSAPAEAIDAASVQNDLRAIAQAEKVYHQEHGVYTSIGQLVLSHELPVAKMERDGYTYDVDYGSDTFHATAHCTRSGESGCTSYSIDETGQIQRD